LDAGLRATRRNCETASPLIAAVTFKDLIEYARAG
jgi:hypothetical protein